MDVKKWLQNPALNLKKTTADRLSISESPGKQVNLLSLRRRQMTSLPARLPAWYEVCLHLIGGCRRNEGLQFLQFEITGD